MTSPATDQTAAAIGAYQFATTTLRTNLAAYVTGLWQSLGEYRNAQMADFVGQVVPVVKGSQQQMASLTAAYLAAHKAAVLGVPSVPVYVNPKAVTGAAVRNGVQPAEVYGRPFHTVWRNLATAKAQQDDHWNWTTPTEDFPVQPPLPPEDFAEQAIKSGLDNAISSAVTDLQLAKTHTSDDVIARDRKAIGYRRVLEGAYSCGLCIVASTRRYNKGELMPIHPACDCSVDPIYDTAADRVFQQDANQQLSAAHAAIAERFGKSSPAARKIAGAKNDKGQPVLYKDVLITHSHGELGPILAVRGQTFTHV